MIEKKKKKYRKIEASALPIDSSQGGTTYVPPPPNSRCGYHVALNLLLLFFSLLSALSFPLSSNLMIRFPHPLLFFFFLPCFDAFTLSRSGLGWNCSTLTSASLPTLYRDPYFSSFSLCFSPFFAPLTSPRCYWQSTVGPHVPLHTHALELCRCISPPNPCVRDLRCILILVRRVPLLHGGVLCFHLLSHALSSLSPIYLAN